jgi:rare lipoprotein A
MLVGNGGVETTQGAPAPSLGPAADYPIVLGEPFTIDGEIYTPADTLNYDAVGYAGLDGGEGVTAAHRTLPLPSYVEITSLDSGKTILVRVERRGPMSGSNLVSLSAAAAARLGVSEGEPVRVRRVNPPETERAELRAGRGAPERMETPKSLVQVLRRKLPAAGAVSLAAARPGGAEPAAQVEASVAPPSVAGAVTAYPLPPPAQAAVAPNAVVVTPTAAAPQASISPPRVAGAAPAASSAPGPVAAAKGAFVIQAGAFANRANAERAAKQLGGFISASGRLFRVRTGPFATRGQADAALAKVRAAGYSDARVTTAN